MCCWKKEIIIFKETYHIIYKDTDERDTHKKYEVPFFNRIQEIYGWFDG